MRTSTQLLFTALLSCGLAACSSGSNGPTCSFNDPSTLQESAWPKFRHDRQNTGSVVNAQVLTNPGMLRWVFPGSGAKGAFAASPVLNSTETRIYIGSADGTLYAISPSDGTQDPGFFLSIGLPISSTALLALRDGKDAVFFGGGDGLLYGVDATGTVQATNWPFSFNAHVTASPNLSLADGTVYTGSLGGFFFGVCPNGVERFGLSTVGVGSSPAVGPDGVVYFGADDHQLRAILLDGTFKWAFGTSVTASIVAAPVVEVQDGTTTAIYAADTSGMVFKVDPNGRPLQPFDFFRANPGIAPVGPIRSSPALAGQHLYVGSDDGKLYAVNTQTGMIDWSLATGAEVASSPAVATGGAAPIVVFGSNDGNVYFVQDNSPAPPQILITFTIGAAVRSSPAIGADGTVYVGADDGRVYAIGAPMAATPAPTVTPTVTPTLTPTVGTP